MTDKPVKYLDKGMEMLVIFIFILMVIVGGMQVFNRFVLNQSLSWSEEFQKFAHIWIVFLTIPIGYARGSHIGMDMLITRFPAKVQRLLSVFTDILWLGFALSLTVHTYRIMQVAKNQTSPGIGLRMDWVYFGLVAGGVYLCIMVLRKLYLRLRGVPC
jgi:TRAP-type C4-dicarboxylate transport system permease small subunit